MTPAQAAAAVAATFPPDSPEAQLARQRLDVLVEAERNAMTRYAEVVPEIRDRVEFRQADLREISPAPSDVAFLCNVWRHIDGAAQARLAAQLHASQADTFGLVVTGGADFCLPLEADPWWMPQNLDLFYEEMRQHELLWIRREL